MKIVIQFLSIFFVLSSISIAQAVYWENIGDFDYVLDLKINSLQDIFICQSSGGIRRSTNDGQTWESLNISNYKIGNLAINDNNEIFASDKISINNSIFKSTDNGNSWNQCSLTGGRMRSLHISQEGYVYAGNDGGKFFRSTDNGGNWISVQVTDEDIKSIGSCLNGQIFIGTAGNGIFSSTDFGISWYQLNNVTHYINSIVVNDSDYIFATNFTLTSNSVLVSTDYGNSWTQSDPFGFTNGGALGIDSARSIYAGYHDVFKSTDNGMNWTNLGGPSYITAIDTYNKKIYLSTSSGVYRYDPDSPPFTAEGSNYFPLSVGNKWQYIRTSYDSDGPSYSLRTETVQYDTLIDNYVYHKMTDFSDWIRYSVDEKIIYIRWNEADHIHLNFNVRPDSQYQILNGWHNYITVTALAGVDSIFNDSRIYGGYLYIGSNYGYMVEFTDSIGITYDRGADSFLDIYRGLIEAIIYDSTGNPKYFTNQIKPTFEINPITTITSSDFILEFKVKHNYTRILPGGSPPWHSGLDFIDSVKMLSYYSKNDSIISNPINIPYHENDPVNYDYVINKQLDTVLMKDGFVFNYQFMAKDKGIITEYASAPDSGYYQCIWEDPSNVQESANKFPNEYSLSQNYPNPFNPTTIIKYQIPERGFVTLKVYDVLGNEIATLVNKEKPAGSYEIDFIASELTSGIYFYRMRVGEFADTKKLILLK